MNVCFFIVLSTLQRSKGKIKLVYIVNLGDFLKWGNKEILFSQVSPTDCGWYDGECSSLCKTAGS